MTHIFGPKLKAGSNVLGIEFVILMVEKDFLIRHMQTFILHMLTSYGLNCRLRQDANSNIYLLNLIVIYLLI